MVFIACMSLLGHTVYYMVWPNKGTHALKTIVARTAFHKLRWRTGSDQALCPTKPFLPTNQALRSPPQGLETIEDNNCCPRGGHTAWLAHSCPPIRLYSFQRRIQVAAEARGFVVLRFQVPTSSEICPCRVDSELACEKPCACEHCLFCCTAHLHTS